MRLEWIGFLAIEYLFRLGRVLFFRDRYRVTQPSKDIRDVPKPKKNPLHPAFGQLRLRPRRAEERILPSGSFGPGPNFDFIRVNRRGAVRFLPQ